MIFQPVVAGQFYTGDSKRLQNEVAGFIASWANDLDKLLSEAQSSVESLEAAANEMNPSDETAESGP